MIAASLSITASADAAAPGLFWKAPEDGKPGEAAGQFRSPGGVAADPATGHLFVADRGNARIVELTAWGEFVKTWGWGVVASGPDNQPAKNEKQKLTVSATSGTYKLTYVNVYRSADSKEQTTVPISFNWPATDPGTPGVTDSIEEALQELESLKDFPGSVTVTGGPGDAGGTSPYQIEFTGNYADKDIPPLAVTASTLAGGSGAGVATVQAGGSLEVCIPANGDVCQSGQAGGSSPGEISTPDGGIALDESKNVYVYETLPESRGEGRSFRVQKFSPAGEFLLMWGGEVNKTKSAEGTSTEAERNLCTKAEVEGGDVCGTGVPGSGKGQFQLAFGVDGRIAVGPEGSIFVGDVERIQKFSPFGAYEAEFKLPGETVSALAMDDAGAFYAAYRSKKEVHKLTAVGETLTEVAVFPATSPKEIALDGAGNVYIVDQKVKPQVIAYDKDGNVIIGYEEHLAESGNLLQGLATNEAGGCDLPGPDIYVSDVSGFVSAYGPAPQDIVTCPPPKVAPTITSQFAKAVGTESATVRAAINPQFWPDTRYYVEYGTGPCSVAGGCPNQVPVPPGDLLTDQVTKQALATKDVTLLGLARSTTYHFRFVAQSTGGGPVFGIDPDEGGPEEASFEAGLEGSFRTQKPGGEVDNNCPNEAFRSGAGARLPDCRAYEMVSPVDKENGDIIVMDKPAVQHVPLSLNQSSPDGGLLTYSSYRAFGDASSAPITSTYLATRTASGWSSHGISPPRGRNVWEVADSIDTQFKAFSEDLCSGWLVSETTPPLTADAPVGFANLYRRDNCGEGADSYQALITTPPDSIEAIKFKPELQGTSADGSQAIFRVRDKLTEDSLPCSIPGDVSTCKLQLYEATPGGLRFVCLLPGEVPAPEGCSAGTSSGLISNNGRSHMVHNAISADGSRIYWSDKAEAFGGKLYVRVNGTETLPVSEAAEAASGLSGEGAQFFTAADDGSRAIFSAGKVGQLSTGNADLYEYRLEGEETEKIAGKLYGLLGASEDAKRIYLVSGEVKDAGATAGKPNLYLYEAGEGGGSFAFIGTLSKKDATVTDSIAYSPVSIIPSNHTAQVSADGGFAAFMSSASLTGYDNTDAESGEADAEVYRYDAAAEELDCVSCNGSGARPSGRNIGSSGNPVWAAAQIPITQTQLYQTPKVLSQDGSRVYFESFESLLGADTNAKTDVYQWEAPGAGPPEAACTEASPSFAEEAGGCIDLISSGKSDQDSSLVDISASGNDVFFATAESLVPQDPALVDIYDARVEGGFAPPATPAPFCEGAGCQSPGAEPAGQTPSSQTFQGPGNQTPKARRCPKGKHLAKVKGRKRCVKNHKKHHHKHHKANKSRRAAR